MAVPASVIEVKTYDDLRAIPDDLNRYELISGEIVMSPAPRVKHQSVLSELHVAMKVFADSRRLGRVLFAPTDVRFSAHNVVEPDLFFIRRDRLHILRRDYVDGAPDLIAEVLSPSNRMVDLLKKAALYADFGVPEYWIIDPDNETITVHQLVDGTYVTQANRDGAAHSQVLPGFSVPVDHLFRDPDGVDPETVQED